MLIYQKKEGNFVFNTLSLNNQILQQIAYNEASFFKFDVEINWNIYLQHFISTTFHLEGSLLMNGAQSIYWLDVKIVF